MKISIINRYILIVLIFLGLQSVKGQRIEIDRLDRDFKGSYSSNKCYQLSQKMIQLDSMYSVGHFYEANYRFFRASDKLGYETSIKSLDKAIELIEKNFPRKIKRSTNINVYIEQYTFQRRYVQLISKLENCYQYVGRPGDAIKALRKLQKRNFVFNFGVNIYSKLAWIHYRNRMYGPNKYEFLKPTVKENLKIASLYIDSIKNDFNATFSGREINTSENGVYTTKNR